MEWLYELANKNIIKVLTGVRRCGKSTIMEHFRDYLRADKKVRAGQIQYYNFESLDTAHLHDYLALYKHIKGKLRKGQMNYVFLDEVQLVPSFERVVNSLFIRTDVDVYVTGSNASLLSGELATLLSGRYVEVNVLPLSFKEYASARPSNIAKAELYRDYLRLSSFPYTLELGDNQRAIDEYLSGILNTVVLKDIIGRYSVKDAMVFNDVLRFMFDNVGNLFSSKKISDTLTSAGRRIAPNTVEVYLEALAKCYILYRAPRYDLKGKHYLKSGAKYYMVDLGLRSELLGSHVGDVGRALENVVYLELLRRGYKVYVGKVGTSEIDFIAQRGTEQFYVQVAATVRGEETLARELAPLFATKDHFPKLLLTLDEDPPAQASGIQQLYVLDWLLDT